MKLFTFLLVALISFSGVCDEIKEGIDVNFNLLNCLDDKIPNNSIEDPEDWDAKSLVLLPSVIENTMGNDSSNASKKLFALTMKYCDKEILSFKEYFEKQANKKINKDT
ncbi:hypothetical protein [Colwellia sp. 12G3]|uniref:hypothetical protein n=1 Tax=Colwellia sp. 12G3 TaxID=2058299 RepID=UPI000C330A5C|nr:hypothetical protein [Colwellia sp. 12G3]PKI15942.1 hypothetical protein CXF71_11620 [Colwellia sp. 12G3]